MKRIYILLLGLAIGIFISSCARDLGNYEYHEINGVLISEKGLSDTTYILYSYVDTLHIHPEIEFTLDENPEGTEGRYEYLWTSVVTAGKVEDTLAKTRDLAWTPTVTPNTYQLFFRVKDKETGLVYLQTSAAVIRTIFSVAYLVLGEDEEGYAQLDAISMSKDTSLVKNVLDDSGLPKLKGPRALWSPKYTNADVYVSTDDGTFRLDKQDLKGGLQTNLKYLFSDPSIFDNGGHVDEILFENSRFFLVVVDGNLYINTSPINTTGFGFARNHYRGEEECFTMGKSVGMNVVLSQNDNIVVYDMDNKCFARLTLTNDGYCEVMNDSGDAEIFKWAPGWDFVTTFNSAYHYNSKNGEGAIFTVLRKGDKFGVYSYTLNHKPPFYYKQAYFDISDATSITEAENIGFSAVTGDMFYSVGSKLYGYDVFGGATSSVLLKDFGNEEIADIYYDQQYELEDYIDGDRMFVNLFYVCTNNPSLPKNECGKVTKFASIDDPNSIRVDERASWTGFHYIKDFAIHRAQ